MHITTDKVVFSLYCLFIILCPFYIFPSGQPQPADIILALASGIMFFKISKRIFFKPPIVYLFIFVLLVFFVNFLNQLNLNYLQLPGNTFISSLFYLFNFFAFILGVFVIQKNSKKRINLLAGILFLSVFIQSVCGLIGFGNSGGRYAIFFNNPNQLGYFALCAFTFFAILPSKLRANIYFLLGMIIMCSYLVLLSESRASLGGIALLTILIFVKEGLKIRWSHIIAFGLIGLIGYFYFGKQTFISNQITKISERNEAKSSTLDEEIKIRGYDRIFIYNHYLWYGAGEGGEQRFSKAFHQGEIHSGFGTILFSYGILGLTLLLVFIFQVIKVNFLNNLLLLIPIFVYNLTHMGFRESLFWMIISMIYITTVYKKNLFYQEYVSASHPHHHRTPLS